ncbi:MAG: hypothetical protein V4509_00795 [Patescibacteria group bacterium]
MNSRLKQIAQAAIKNGSLQQGPSSSATPAKVDPIGPQRLKRICEIVGIELPYTLTGCCAKMSEEAFNVLEAYCTRDRPTSKGFVTELVKFMSKNCNNPEVWMDVVELEQIKRHLRGFGCPKVVDKDTGVFVRFWSSLQKAITTAWKNDAPKHRQKGPPLKFSRFKATPAGAILGKVHRKLGHT